MQNRWDNKDNMKKMQQDAILRVKEMQSKAQEKISQTTMSSDKQSNEIVKDNVQDTLSLNTDKKFDATELLKSLTQDSERNLLMILVLLLMEEQTDPGLMLSLMYLIV